jgi:hypothetical protein
LTLDRRTLIGGAELSLVEFSVAFDHLGSGNRLRKSLVFVARPKRPDHKINRPDDGYKSDLTSSRFDFKSARRACA